MSRRRVTSWRTVDRRLRQVAATLGVSHVELCERAGCSYYPPGRRERHHPNAPPAYLERIARAWKLQPDIFELDAIEFAAALLPKIQHAIHASLPR